jgi:hypothetical protein
MKFGNEVKGARPMGGYRLRVVFQDGYIGEIDLRELFENSRGPMTEPFRDGDFFLKVSVDPELAVVTWPNGYDICSDVLRYYCELGRVASREEMNQYFNPLTSPAVLNDKPIQ